LHWDRGDLVSYYSYTGYLLSSIFYELFNIQKDSFNGCDQVLVDNNNNNNNNNNNTKFI